MTLRAVLASTGQYLDVLAQPTDTVLQLKQALAVEFDLATHHQVLLTEEGYRLDTKQPLSAYPSLQGPPALPASSPSPSSSAPVESKADGGPPPIPIPVPAREPPCVFVFDRQHMTAHLASSASASASASSPSASTSASASASSSTVVVSPGGGAGSGIATTPTPDIPPMKAIDLEALATKLPAMPPAPTFHPLLSSNSLLVRGLPEFERILAHHTQLGKAHVDAGAERYRVAAAVEGEVRNQLRAMEAAARNLQGGLKHMARTLADFSERFQAHETQQKRLIAGFEGALEKLRATELHPVLRKGGRTTLLDCIQEARMRSYAAECQKQLDGLIARVRAAQAEYAALEAAAQQVTSPLLPVPATPGASASSSSSTAAPLPHPAPDLPALQAHLSALGQALTTEAESHLQALVDDHAAAGKYLHGLASGAMPSPPLFPNVNEAAAAFDAQQQRHKTQILPRLVELDNASARLLADLTQCQQRTYAAGHTRLALQAKILHGLSALGSRLYAYSGALATEAGKGSQPWDQLSMIEAMPDAYHACVSEVSRRRAFRRHFHERANTAAASLQRLREEESAVRHRFHAALGRQPLLEEIFAGITEGPPFLQLNLRDTDAVLPELDLPEHHAAFPSASSSSSSASSPSPSPSASPVPASEQQQQGQVGQMARLQAENAALRAQLQKLQQQQQQQKTEEEESKERQQQPPSDGATDELRKRLLSLESLESSLLQSLREIDARLNTSAAGEGKEGGAPRSPILTALAGAGDGDKLFRRVAQRASEVASSLEKSRLNGADLELKLQEAKRENTKQANRIRELQAKLQKQSTEHTTLGKNALLYKSELLHHKNELERVRSEKDSFLSEMQFRATLFGMQVNDKAIFARTAKGHYEAILFDQPHRYLSMQSRRGLEKQGLVTDDGPAYLILQIILLDRHEATPARNPFDLPLGTVYFEATAESARPAAPSSPSSSASSLASSSSSLSEQLRQVEGKRSGARKA